MTSPGQNVLIIYNFSNFVKVLYKYGRKNNLSAFCHFAVITTTHFLFRLFNNAVTYWLNSTDMMTSSNGNIFRVSGLCMGNSPVTGEFPAQRPVTRSFDVFFDLCLNKELSKQSWGWWSETQSRSLWRQYNGYNLFVIWWSQCIIIAAIYGYYSIEFHWSFALLIFCRQLIRKEFLERNLRRFDENNSLKFDRRGLIDNKSSLVKLMVWRKTAISQYLHQWRANAMTRIVPSNL